MSQSKPFVTCGLFLVSLTALLSWSVPCRADDPEPAEAIRQIGIMARVLETRLNEEMPGAIVGGSIFQPGGVRGFRVPGVGVVFEINVNFPVVEPKPGERPSAAARNEDLWNRIERGEIVGPGVVEGMSSGNFYYAPVPAASPASPAAPVVPSSAAPAAPDAPAATPHAPGAPAPPHAPGDPMPPHATVGSGTGGFGGGGGYGSVPIAPGAPMPPHATVGSGTGGFGGAGGYGSVSVAGTAYGGGAGGYGYGGGREPRRNIAVLERVILDVLARYGERLKAIPADENIIVLVAGGGGGGRAVARSVRQPAPSPAQPLAALKDLDNALENMKDQMKAAEDRMRDARAQMDAAAAQKAQAQQSDNAAAIEQAEAQVQAAKDRIQAAAQQMRAAGEQVRATGERAKAAQPTRTARAVLDTRRAPYTGQAAMAGMPYGVAEAGAPGGGSWVLKVKKGDLAGDPDQLRKRVVIESY